MQGLWEAYRAGKIDVEAALDDLIVRSAGVLADKGCGLWKFTSATEEASLWQDLHGNYWIVDHRDGEIREWGT